MPKDGKTGNGKNGKRNGKRNGKPVEPDRTPLGQFLPGHGAIIANLPGRPPTRKITAEMLRMGDEKITVIDSKTGKAIEIERNTLLAERLWEDALAAKAAPVMIHAREYLGKRIDPAPEDTERSLIPANQEIHSALTINILQQLQERTGGAPTTRDVLDALAKVPVEWHMNGEAEHERD